MARAADQLAHPLGLTSDNTHLSEPKMSLGVPASGRLGAVSDLVREYVAAAISENTRRAYRADVAHFLAWGGTIPASDVMIAEYLAAHAGELAISTLVRRLAGISKAHTSRGLESPIRSDLVHATLRGIRRRHGKPQRQVAAAVKEDVLAMIAGLGEGLKDKRDRALLLVAFAGAFRRSELVAINCKDIDHVPEGVVITIRRSKTDQAGQGRKVAIPLAHGAACPVKALDAWLSAAAITDGTVFRSVNRHGHVSDQRLSPEAVALVIKARAAAAGLDAAKYSGHSLRAGLVTSATNSGASLWKIKAQTGHASDAMLARYVRDGSLFDNNTVTAIL